MFHLFLLLCVVINFIIYDYFEFFAHIVVAVIDVVVVNFVVVIIAVVITINIK